MRRLGHAFARIFGVKMCRQPGTLCDSEENDWAPFALAAMGIGLGKDGGEDSEAAEGHTKPR